jgi:hypothetical protein
MFRTSVLVSFLTAFANAEIHSHASCSKAIVQRGVATCPVEMGKAAACDEDQAIQEEARRVVGHSIGDF